MGKIRKITCYLLIISLTAVLCACGTAQGGENTTSPPDEEIQGSPLIVKEIMQTVSFPEMKEVTYDDIEEYYGISPDEVVSYKAYTSSSESLGDEIAVFEYSDSETADKITQGLFSRWSSQMESFKQTNEDEYQKVYEGLVKVNAKYIIYIVCDNMAMAEAVFDEYEPDAPVLVEPAE